MSGPLHELKILDFTTLLPGPYATMALADMGAHVLRVISGSRPDMVAYIPPFLPGTNLSSAFAYLGRGKRCQYRTAIFCCILHGHQLPGPDSGGYRPAGQ